MEERKKDHIDLALDSRTTADRLDRRFNYEPVLGAHPAGEEKPFDFLGKKLKVPVWVSSMTGGTKMAGHINRNLARACHEFGMGMGLGSCRIIMDDDTYFEDFNLRHILGEEHPFFANLGIAQLEEFLKSKSADRIRILLDRLQADGLVVHINPIQEWCQPEGDRLEKPPLETLEEFLELADYPVIVKEVGQGMGPLSLKALLKLPLAAIEFGAFGGTNFTLLELGRSDPKSMELYRPLAFVGHDAAEMLDTINTLVDSETDIRCRELIISGGIRDFLDGYNLLSRSRLPAVYGQASGFLRHAMESYETLQEYVRLQVRGLQLAKAYLTPKED